MKRYLCIALFAAVLSGCGLRSIERNEYTHTDDILIQTQSEETEEIPETALSAAQSEIELTLQAYQAVLENKDTVYTAASRQNKYINDLVNGDVSIYKYAIVDFDSDKIPEVVLQLRYGTNDTYGFYVLHFGQGIVYLFGFPYRGLNQLKADGTFGWANSAFNNGIAIINFDGDTYTKTNLAYRESDYDGNVSFYIGSESVSGEDYSQFREMQNQKPGAEWHEYSIDEFQKSAASFVSESQNKSFAE